MTWRRPLPILVGVLIAVLPPPPGLTLEGWRYFAIFVAVIVGLITESLPGAATGLIGITVTAMLGLVEPRRSTRSSGRSPGLQTAPCG